MLTRCRELLQKFLWPFSPFHWPTFQKDLANGTVAESLHYAMIASTVRASRKLTAQFGSPVTASDFFACKSRQCILDNLDHPSLEDVQALLLITLLDWGSSRGTRAFMYLGLAARMALTFLPEGDHRLGKDFLAAETARRTIWMVFMVEQFLSSGNGRIPSMRAKELPISLPCSEMNYLFGIRSVVPMFDGGMPPRHSTQDDMGTVGEFGSMIQISSIWNLVATSKFKCRPDEPFGPRLNQLEDMLSNWKASLPTQYQDMPGHLDLHVSLGTGFAFGFSHSVYHCALIFLHRERLYACDREVDRSLSDRNIRDKSIDTILFSAERIIEIIKALEATNTDGDTVVIFPIFMLYACFTASAATAYISIKKLASSREVSFKIVRESLRILASMKRTWPLVEGWHMQLSSMVKVLQDRAMGIDSAASQVQLFETLQYGHVNAPTSIPSVEAQSSATEFTTLDGDVTGVCASSGLAEYIDELSPSFPSELYEFLATQDDLSIFLG